MKYDEYMDSPEWKALRRQIIIRDGGKCRLCGLSERLHVHHRTYERFGNESPSDLTTICEFCHDLFTAASRVKKPHRWDREPLSVRIGFLKTRIAALAEAMDEARDENEAVDLCIEKRALQQELDRLSSRQRGA